MAASREPALRSAEAAGALGLILLRVAVGFLDPWWTLAPWWTDWMLLVAAFWLLQATATSARLLAWSAPVLMVLLALIYLARQGPYLLRAYGFAS